MTEATPRSPILISCSGGGFAGEISALVTGFSHDDDVVFAFPRTGARSLQKRMKAGHFFLTRDVSFGRRFGIKKSPLFWLSATYRCIRQVKRTSPKLAVFVGSAQCLPLLIACRILNVKCVYIESITRVEELSTTGKIVYMGRLANEFLVQWPDIASVYRRAKYRGTVYDRRKVEVDA